MFGIMLNTSAFSPTLLMIGFIVMLPFLLMNGEQIKRARTLLVMVALALIPVTLWATVEIATACDDWDWLVNEWGYAVAWTYWLINC